MRLKYILTTLFVECLIIYMHACMMFLLIKRIISAETLVEVMQLTSLSTQGMQYYMIMTSEVCSTERIKPLHKPVSARPSLCFVDRWFFIVCESSSNKTPPVYTCVLFVHCCFLADHRFLGLVECTR